MSGKFFLKLIIGFLHNFDWNKLKYMWTFKQIKNAGNAAAVVVVSDVLLFFIFSFLMFSSVHPPLLFPSPLLISFSFCLLWGSIFSSNFPCCKFFCKVDKYWSRIETVDILVQVREFWSSWFSELSSCSEDRRFVLAKSNILEGKLSGWFYTPFWSDF